MSLPMQRSKLFAIALAALVATAGSVLLLSGGAAAAQWHSYQGDIHPGHAYAIPVPADAEAIEFAFADAGEGRARFALFDPAGAPVGYYELSSSPAAASLAKPVEGLYAVYVYEVTGGALALRVSSEQAPDLKLQKVELAREDIVLTRVDAPQRLDQLMTAQLPRAPVFVTLLYEGSAQNLDASIASPRGVVATVEDETATAFSPGVWSTQTGVRASDPANLAAGAYTVTATADEFQGTLMLTALSLRVAAPTPIEAPVVDPPVAPIRPDEVGVFALAAREPVAVTLAPGLLTLADAQWIASQAEQAPVDENAHHPDHGHRHHRVADAIVLVYTPSDELLGVVRIDDQTPLAKIDIPEGGEYVLYASQAGDKGLLVKAATSFGLLDVRALEVGEVVHEFDVGMNIGGSAPIAFELASIPLEMALESDDGISAFDSVMVDNANGPVLEMHRMLTLGGGGIWMYGAEMPENFASGEHVLHVDGLVTSSSFRVVTLHFLRQTAETVTDGTPAEDIPEDAEQDQEATEEEEETNEEEEDGLIPPLLDLPLPPL